MIKYAVLDDVEQLVVVTKEGDIATGHYNDNCIILNYYGNKISKNFNIDRVWDELNIGRRYWKELENKQEIDQDVIILMLESLDGRGGYKRDNSVNTFDEKDLRTFLNS